MAIRRPGQTSHSSLLSSGLWGLVFLFSLVAGHLIAAIWLWLYLTGPQGLADIATWLDIHTGWLWLCMLISVILDIWIQWSIRKDQKKLLSR